MSLSTDELLLQMNILATKTDPETNSNMVYSTIAALNKGLNPEYFSGNNTKIVNAINKIAVDIKNTSTMVTDLITKTNSVLMDTYSEENKIIWEKVQELMEKSTIIEGLQRMLEGKQQDKILGITPDDIGKILSVDQAEDGEMMVKAIDFVLNADHIEYEHEDFPEIKTMGDALDKLFEVQEAAIGKLTWEMIENKPDLGNSLELNNEGLHLKSEEDEILSTVELATDLDIDNIISGLM